MASRCLSNPRTIPPEGHVDKHAWNSGTSRPTRDVERLSASDTFRQWMPSDCGRHCLAGDRVDYLHMGQMGTGLGDQVQAHAG